jgi:hypothetical protein
MTFVLSVLREVWLRYLVVMTALMLVNLVEKFDYLARFSLEYGVSFVDFLYLQMMALPEAVEFVLPVSTVVACYLVILDIRERREFMALASVGRGPRLLIILALGIALAATALGVIVTGFVQPAAAHAFRRSFEEAVAEVIIKANSRARFIPVSNRVFQVMTPKHTAGRRLRIFDFTGAQVSTVQIADCAGMHIDAPTVWADDCSTRAYEIEQAPLGSPSATLMPTIDCEGCTEGARRAPVRMATIRRTSQSFDAGGLLHIDPSTRPAERLLPRLLQMEDGHFVSGDDVRLGVKALLAAFTNTFAVLCALIAVAYSSLGTRLIAPSAMIVAMIVGSVVMISGGALPTALLNPPGVIAFIMGVLGLLTGAIVLAVRLLHNQLISPRMKRS